MKADFLKRKRNIIIILIILFAVYLISPSLSTISYVKCQSPPLTSCHIPYSYGEARISTEAIDRLVATTCGDEFFTSYTSTCYVKANEPFILMTSQAGGYGVSGCWLSSIAYDNASIDEMEPLYWYGPFSLLSGYTVYHRFVAKEAGESVIYSLGACDYFRRYRIVAG
jgi:hypothetical protein